MPINKNELLNHLAKVLYSEDPLKIESGSREEQVNSKLLEIIRRDEEVRAVDELAKSLESARHPISPVNSQQQFDEDYIFATAACDGTQRPQSFEEIVDSLSKAPLQFGIPRSTLRFIVAGHSLFARWGLVIVNADPRLASQVFTLTMQCENGVSYTQEKTWDGTATNIDFTDVPLFQILSWKMLVGGVEAMPLSPWESL